MTAPGEGTRRLVVDARAEHGTARARALAGALAIGAGAWLLALPHPLTWPFALAGIVFGALWLRRALVQRRGEHDYIDLSPAALEIYEAGRTERVVWSDIDAIEIDEDRLVVRIERNHGTALHIEPRYGSDVYALRTRLRGAWRSADVAHNTDPGAS